MRKATKTRQGERSSSGSISSFRKSPISSPIRPVSVLKSCLAGLPRPTGSCTVCCGNLPKAPLPWPASRKDSPTTSPPGRRRHWWLPYRATRSRCHAHHAPDRTLGVRVPVPPARRPPAQPGPSRPQPEDRRTGQQGQAGPQGAGPADMVESLADLKSFLRKDRNRPLFNIRRQWVSKSMKEAAVAAGIDPARVHPRALSHTYGRNTGRSTSCLGLQR